MKIVIDAGHGPDTPGKRCPDDSMREYEFNSAVALLLKDLLAGFAGVETIFTHSDARDVPLQERTNCANQWGADLFISIHANASGSDWSEARGTETYVYTSRPIAGVALAVNVQQGLTQATGLMNRGVKAADFHVLRETKMTAILVECGFMTNKQEAELLKSKSFRKSCAAALADGIAETYGLSRIAVEEEPFLSGDDSKQMQGQVDQLKQAIQALDTQVAGLNKQITSMQAQMSRPVPDWARNAVEAAEAKELIESPNGGSLTFYRILTILHRLKMF
jgi:hypothetical protein